MLLVVFHRKHNALNFSFQFYFIAKLGSNKMCEMAQLLMISELFLKVRRYYLFLFSCWSEGLDCCCVCDRETRLSLEGKHFGDFYFLLEAISIVMNACVSAVIAESWTGNKCILLKAKSLVLCEALGNYVKPKCIT